MGERDKYVVVVDDDADMGEAVERLLNAAGFTATAFTSAEDLLESGIAPSAICLVLDVHLPGLSGFELYTHLRAQGEAVPAIFMTAYDDPVSERRARAVGAAAYFIKPFEGAKLLDCIEKIRPKASAGN